MYRVVELGNKLYALEVENVEVDLEGIQGFVDEGNIVIMCNELKDLEKYGISLDDIEIVV